MKKNSKRRAGGQFAAAPWLDGKTRQHFLLSVTRAEFLKLPMPARRRYLAEQADKMLLGKFDVLWVTDTGRLCHTLCGTVGDALEAAQRGLFDASGDVTIRVMARPPNVEPSEVADERRSD